MNCRRAGVRAYPDCESEMPCLFFGGETMSDDDAMSQLMRQARRLLRDRAPAEAVALLQQIANADRGETHWLLLGTALFQAGELARAQEAFEAMTRSFPFAVEGWVNLGCVLSRQGDFRKSAEVLRRAVQKNKRCAEAWYNLGIAQKGLKSDSMAVSAYKEALRINPELTDALMNLGRIYLERNSLMLAQKCFQDVLKLRPEHKRAQAHLREVQAAQKELKREESPFGRLVDVAELENSDASTQRRQISAVERLEERELCREVTRGVRVVAREMAQLLDPDLRDQLHGLERLLVDDDARSRNNSIVSDISVSLQRLREGRQVINAALGRVRSLVTQK